MNNKNKTLLALLLGLAAAPAFADEGHYYTVVSIGQSGYSGLKGQMDGALVGAGMTGVTSSTNDHDMGYKLQVGYQFDENFGVEGGYVNLGKTSYDGQFAGSPYNGGAGSAHVDMKVSGFNGALVATVPFTRKFSGFGKLGLIDAKVDESASVALNGVTSGSTSTTGWKTNFGAGVAYKVNRDMSVRAEAEQYRKVGDDSTGEANVNLLSAGVQLNF